MCIFCLSDYCAFIIIYYICTLKTQIAHWIMDSIQKSSACKHLGQKKNAHSGSYVIECGTSDAGEIQNGTDAVYWDIWVKSIEGI